MWGSMELLIVRYRSQSNEVLVCIEYRGECCRGATYLVELDGHLAAGRRDSPARPLRKG